MEVERMVTNEVSSLVGKLEIKVDINASAGEFYHMFSKGLYLVSDTIPGIVQGIDLLDGEWGTTGSMILWNYVHDGKAKVAKDSIEVVDLEKNLITFRVLEGDLMEEFKNFTITLQVTPKYKGSGSIVQWKLEYEKISEEVDHPKTFLQLGVVLAKLIDKHLLSQP